MHAGVQGYIQVCVGRCMQVSACANKCAGVHIGVWGCMQVCRIHAGMQRYIQIVRGYMQVWGVHTGVCGVHAGMWCACKCVGSACRCAECTQVCGMHVGVCVVHACVWGSARMCVGSACRCVGYIYMCTHAYEGQKTPLDVIFQVRPFF